MIEVNHVSKEYISPKKYPGLKGAIKGLFAREKVKKVAVDDISFTIADGEIVGYIGSNGAGKSTTIKMMTGILRPTSGHIRVNGIDPSKNRKENASGIGVVFGQRTQLWWDLPLSESFLILKEIYDVSDEDSHPVPNREWVCEYIGFAEGRGAVQNVPWKKQLIDFCRFILYNQYKLLTLSIMLRERCQYEQ